MSVAQDDSRQIPTDAYDDEVASSGMLAEKATAAEVVSRLSAWQPMEPSMLLTLPSMPTPILKGLILPGTVAIAPGEGGAGKSTLFMNMAIAIATGTEFLGFDCLLPGTTVHLLAEDDQQRAQFMLTKLLLDETAQMLRETYTQAQVDDYVDCVRRRIRLVSVRGLGATLATSDWGTFRTTSTVDAICAALDKERITDLRVIIFDTLTRFAGVSLDSNDSAPIVLTALEKIAERTGAFVLALHHTGKAAAREKNEDQYSARGASAITDHARLVMRLRPMDDAEVTEAGLIAGDEQTPRQYLRLTVPKSNYFARPEPLTICRIGFLFRLASQVQQSAGDTYRGHLRIIVTTIDALRRQGLRASKAALEDQKQLGSRAQIRKMLTVCIEQQWLEVSGAGAKSEIAVTDLGRQVAQKTDSTSPNRSGEMDA